jgi:hypothetical protein
VADHVLTHQYRSERLFKVWTYSVSHCRLLLRSTIEGGLPSRIDVYFGGVELMLLRPYYHGLSVAVAGPDEVAQYEKRYGEIGRGATLFMLEPNLGSFVVAGVMQWHEDTGGFQDRSFFGRFNGA